MVKQSGIYTVCTMSMVIFTICLPGVKHQIIKALSASPAVRETTLAIAPRGTSFLAGGSQLKVESLRLSSAR